MKDLETVPFGCKWNESDYTAVNLVSAGCSLCTSSNKALNSIYRPLGRIITRERVFFSRECKPTAHQSAELLLLHRVCVAEFYGNDRRVHGLLLLSEQASENICKCSCCQTKREETSREVVIVVCFTTSPVFSVHFVSLIGGVWSTCPPNDAFNLKETIHLEMKSPSTFRRLSVRRRDAAATVSIIFIFLVWRRRSV